MMTFEDKIKATICFSLVWASIMVFGFRHEEQLNRIEANQIELIENQAAMFQDSFHSNE